MNLDTITAVKRPASTDEIRQWHDGYAWLAGGTWLFSELQPAVHTLIDLHQLNWPALQASAEGLEIAATCRSTRPFSPSDAMCSAERMISMKVSLSSPLLANRDRSTWLCSPSEAIVAVALKNAVRSAESPV